MDIKSGINFLCWVILAIMLVILLLLCAIVVVLAVLSIQLYSNLGRYHAKGVINKATDRLEDLPTISLCIPARNETHALEDCLGTAISSDYPKLEIIVLDDCSQDRTSHIIRGFAQDGVRFVKGREPSGTWLGKNNAYDVLAHEARGEYLVFMSVDTRFETHTLSRLIAYMQVNKLSMASVLPRRHDSWRASVLFAPLRYFWQVILPLGINVPTATSLWAVHGVSLAEIGGIKTYKDKIMLENVLAKHFFAKSEYRFLIANDDIQAWYAKKWSSQVETAVRLWYPTLKKNLAFSFVAIAAHFMLFIFPFLTLIVGGMYASPLSIVLSLCAITLGLVLYWFYLRRIQTGAQVFVGMFLLPLVALQEINLIITSYYRYKKGDVSWKGRNVCYPVLKRTP